MGVVRLKPYANLRFGFTIDLSVFNPSVVYFVIVQDTLVETAVAAHTISQPIQRENRALGRWHGHARVHGQPPQAHQGWL